MKVLAIDPGPDQSAYILWDGDRARVMGIYNNDRLASDLFLPPWEFDVLAIEMVACYGMPVGAEVFNTCRWIGKFEALTSCADVRLIFRKDIKMHLCHSMRAKDANVRQALIDKHGPCGSKKAPGRLYGVSGHIWAALAVADYVLSQKI